MKNKQKIQVEQIFADSIDAISKARDSACELTAEAAEKLVTCLQRDGKILICGNGGSASDSLHFSSELLNKYVRIRQPLAAISLVADTATLTSISNDDSFDQVFAKQVRALGRRGDILVVITTSGNSPSILEAVTAAHEGGIDCLALNGKTGGALSDALNSNDINIVIGLESTARIQEVHGIIIHAVCEIIDQNF